MSSLETVLKLSPGTVPEILKLKGTKVYGVPVRVINYGLQNSPERLIFTRKESESESESESQSEVYNFMT